METKKTGITEIAEDTGGTENTEGTKGTGNAEGAGGEPKKKKKKGKFFLVFLLTLVLLGGVSVGVYFLWQGTNYLVTENARVTTPLFFVMPTVPGTLERFTIREGHSVRENEVLGWVEGSEAFRAPFDGLVLRTWAEQNQMVAPPHPVAVIADISNFHIQANIEETYIARIRRGQPVTVTIDALGRQQFAGYVAEIGRVTDAALTGEMMNFTTSGRFTKVIQLLPVRINLTSDVDKSSLIGLNARVQLRLGADEPADSFFAPLRNLIGRVYDRVRDTVIEGQLFGFQFQLGFPRDHSLTNAAGYTGMNPVMPVNNQHLVSFTEHIKNPASITVRGVVESVERRSIYTTLPNMVRRVYAETGDLVSEGQILAVLDDGDLLLTAAHQQAENALRSARIELEARRIAHENNRFLYNAGLLARDDLRHSENALAHARNAFSDAQVMLNAALRTLERQLIRAPIDGAITAVFAREGMPGPGLLFIVEDIDNLRIMTRFREYDIGRIRTGMDVAISSDATGNAVYQGIISRIHPAAAASPVVEFGAEVAVTSQNTGLRIGMNTRLNLVLE